MAKVLPEAGTQVTATDPLRRSDALVVNETAAPEEAVASAVLLPGSTSVGAVRSVTMI